MSAREARYRELLNSAPPASAPPKEPSLIDRMVTPITNALGMSRNKPTAPSSANTSRATSQQQQERARAEQQQNDAAKSKENDPRNREGHEDDPDTDTIPPTLTQAMFVPAEVHDGETTTFNVVVNDNLSGVRSVSGVIASPSGALQGFACRKEGESPNYTASITVPKDAAEGTWTVKYLTLSDNASNSTNLNAAQGSLPQTASFKVVSSQSDSKGPTLNGVMLERMAMHAGERNMVYVQAEDDKSGVSLVSGVFVSPGKQARLGFGCRLSDSGSWECPLTPPTCLDCGLWQLEQIQLQDKANNTTTFRMDNQYVAGVKLDIAGDSCDASPPQIMSLSLFPTVVSNMEDSQIRVEAILADEGCGVASLSGQAIPPNGVGGQRAFFSFEPSEDGRTFIGVIPIAKHSAKGVWTIAWLQALDKGHNLRAYSSNDPVIARVSFRVR